MREELDGRQRIIDTHAHIIDPARFPFPGGPGYKPLPHEVGTSEDYGTVLDAHGVAHALLVQPSGYGYDNSALLDAMARHPGRFKTIAVVDPETSESELVAFMEQGVVGVRFNLLSHRADALEGPRAQRFLARLKELGWFAQVFADDAQWQAVAATLRRSRSGCSSIISACGTLRRGCRSQASRRCWPSDEKAMPQ